MTQKVLKVGDSAAVTIPRKSLKDLGIKIGDEIKLEINYREKKVIIEPARKVNKELLDWTDRFITRYQSALRALAKK